MSDGVVTFMSVAHPWMCDAMGHVNVRHYAAMFDDAGFQFLGRIAGDENADRDLGWADVRGETDFLHETPAGACLTIRSHVEKVGTSSLVTVHVMTGSHDGVVHARARFVTVRFDLVARRKVELGPGLRARAAALMLPPAGTDRGHG
jgi:acyl-CoA thioester hydrolase